MHVAYCDEKYDKVMWKFYFLRKNIPVLKLLYKQLFTVYASAEGAKNVHLFLLEEFFKNKWLVQNLRTNPGSAWKT